MVEVGFITIICMGVIFMCGVIRLWYKEILQCRQTTLPLHVEEH